MNKLDIVKGAAELAVSFGVAGIVSSAIKLTTAPETKLPKRILIGIGGFVLSSMVGDAAASYASAQIDSAVAGIRKGWRTAANSAAVGEEDISETDQELIDHATADVELTKKALKLDNKKKDEASE